MLHRAAASLSLAGAFVRRDTETHVGALRVCVRGSVSLTQEPNRPTFHNSSGIQSVSFVLQVLGSVTPRVMASPDLTGLASQ